jgi:hypothetical protein
VLFSAHDERPFRDLAHLLAGYNLKNEHELSCRHNFALLFSRFLKFVGHVEWSDISVGNPDIKSTTMGH